MAESQRLHEIGDVCVCDIELSYCTGKIRLENSRWYDSYRIIKTPH